MACFEQNPDFRPGIFDAYLVEEAATPRGVKLDFVHYFVLCPKSVFLPISYIYKGNPSHLGPFLLAMAVFLPWPFLFLAKSAELWPQKPTEKNLDQL